MKEPHIQKCCLDIWNFDLWQWTAAVGIQTAEHIQQCQTINHIFNRIPVNLLTCQCQGWNIKVLWAQNITDVAKLIMTTVLPHYWGGFSVFIIIVIESKMTEPCPSKHTQSSLWISPILDCKCFWHLPVVIRLGIRLPWRVLHMVKHLYLCSWVSSQPVMSMFLGFIHSHKASLDSINQCPKLTFSMPASGS